MMRIGTHDCWQVSSRCCRVLLEYHLVVVGEVQCLVRQEEFEQVVVDPNAVGRLPV